MTAASPRTCASRRPTATRRFEHSRYRLRVARAPAGLRFGRPRTALSATRHFELTGLVAGRDGLAVVALRRDERMQVVVARHGAPFAAPQDLGSSTVSVAPPSLALAPGGGVLAAWSPTSASTAQAAPLAPRGRRFRAARAVSAAGEAASYAAAIAGPGGAGVAWTKRPSVPGYPSQTYPWPVAGRVRFARLNSSAGDFSAPVTLADVTISGAGQVALPRGRAATTWRQYIDKTVPGDSDFFVNSQLFAHAPQTGDTASRALSRLPAIAFRPVIGALGDRALIAWREAPVRTIGSRLRLAVAGPHGWEPTMTFANAGRDIQTTPETGIAEDEHPAAGDLTIAAACQQRAAGMDHPRATGKRRQAAPRAPGELPAVASIHHRSRLAHRPTRLSLVPPAVHLARRQVHAAKLACHRRLGTRIGKAPLLDYTSAD